MKIIALKKHLMLLGLGLCSISLYAQFNVTGGYFPYWRSTAGLDFGPYNYLYYAFVIPSNTGEVQLAGNANSAFTDFKTATASLSSKRLISVGSTNCANMATSSTARKNFASGLRVFCRTHDFDGIDMDWEAIDNATDRANFTALMQDIRQEIDSTNLEFVITVGFGNYWLQWYEDLALQQADFLQIMIYDQTGTWASSPYGNHSSMAHFQQAESYWVGRGFSHDKLVMGLPFYGYRFNSTSGGLATAVTYSEILTQFPLALASDNNLSDASGYYWFNGVDLLKQKINYARDNGFKGVFVWEIAQDNITHPLSLTQTLSETTLLNTRESNAKPIGIHYFPSPSHQEITLESPNPLGEISILSILGEEVFQQNILEKQTKITLTGLSPGMYYLKANNKFIGKIWVE